METTESLVESQIYYWISHHDPPFQKGCELYTSKQVCGPGIEPGRANHVWNQVWSGGLASS